VIAVELAEEEMAKKRPASAPQGAMSEILRHNAARLGWTETVIPYSAIAKAIQEKTGKTISRQRVATMFSSHNISDESLELLAKGMGVSVKDLIRPIRK
jgi:hypothetical protein